MKRILLLSLGVLMVITQFSIPIIAMPATVNEPTILTFSVETATGNKGDEILVPITIAGNKDGINIIAMTVTFDNAKLEWQNLGMYNPSNVATHPWIQGDFIPFSAAPGRIRPNSTTFMFMDLNGVYNTDGTLITLKLRVKENAPDGDATISLSFKSVGDSRGALNETQYKIKDGKVIAPTITYTTTIIIPQENENIPAILNKNPLPAAKGEIVNLPAMAVDINYNFIKWEVIEGNVAINNPVSLSEAWFVMGDANVLIKAIFEPVKVTEANIVSENDLLK